MAPIPVGRRRFFPPSAPILLLFVFLLHTSQTRGDASSSFPDLDHRVWAGDAGSSFLPSGQNILAAASAFQSSSVPQVPYMTARIFNSGFTHSFPISPDRKFIRLHFYPSDYGNHAAGDARFATARARNINYLFFEYSVNALTSRLDLTFSPSPDVPNSYAFINGIEIIPMNDIFWPEFLIVVGTPATFSVDHQTPAFQTMYRLNVGGNHISPAQDGQLYMSWSDDSDYIFGAASGVSYSKDGNVSITYTRIPSCFAPKEVYETARSMGGNARVNLNYNLTWALAVDPGFLYLVRLHFSEIQYPITKVNQRVFSIYLDNQTAVGDFDVITRSGGIGSTVYQDFIDLWLELHPSTASKPEFYDAILNGLEIFKVSSFYGNLAGPKPNPPPRPSRGPGQLSPAGENRSGGEVPVVAVAVPGGVVTVVLIFALALAVRRSGRKLRRCTPQSFQKFADAAEMKVPGDGVDSPVMNDARWRHDAGCAGDNEELPLVSASRASLA
ncbi:unnamed protein product [Spirodela intermedia]|uniref:Malectin-like domain-containing protein n=1 Tax=Spirodela intermedia TaxID=51605 RepID=A0A7I8JZ02_SPIIN|nr:unnamed protein product [Spirodela intermedia]